MSAGRTVETVLYLAGFSNVKSKVLTIYILFFQRYVFPLLFYPNFTK